MIIALAMMTSSCFPVISAEIHVAPTNGSDSTSCGAIDSPCATLSYAISNRIVPGGTVVAMPGVHRGAGGEGIQVSRALTVTGSGTAAETVLDCEGFGRG